MLATLLLAQSQDPGRLPLWSKVGKSRTWTDDQLRVAAEDSISIAGVLRKLGLRPVGGNYKSINAHILRMAVDITHFTGQGHNRKSWGKSIPLEEILVENSTYTNTGRLKKRLIEAGLLVYVCKLCDLSTWQEKCLTLHLDHVNGINTDHRLDNLRLLCPNCHSQTETYCRGSWRNGYTQGT